MNVKHTIEEFRALVEARGGTVSSDAVYVNCNTGIPSLCDRDHPFSPTLQGLKEGTWCSDCRYENNINDLTGQQFGYLQVLRRAERNAGDGHVRWVCKCSCGRPHCKGEITVIGND